LSSVRKKPEAVLPLRAIARAGGVRDVAALYADNEGNSPSSIAAFWKI
jgi:hypothetical protein